MIVMVLSEAQFGDVDRNRKMAFTAAHFSGGYNRPTVGDPYEHEFTLPVSPRKAALYAQSVGFGEKN